MSDFETDDFHDSPSSDSVRKIKIESCRKGSFFFNSIFFVERAWGRAIVISKPSGVENNNKQQAAEARFGVRRLPGLLPKNRRQIRTQRGPLTPKPPMALFVRIPAG
jgi:hypothetical protein